MLTIRSFPSGLTCTSTYEWPISNILKRFGTLRLGIGFFNPYTNQPLNGSILTCVDGMIHGSSSREFVDKPCQHYQVSGDLVQIPSYEKVEPSSAQAFPSVSFSGQRFSKLLYTDGFWIDTASVPDEVHSPAQVGDYKNVQLKQCHYKYGDTFGMGMFIVSTECYRVRYGQPYWRTVETKVIEPFKFENASHTHILNGNLIPWCENARDLLAELTSVSYTARRDQAVYYSATGTTAPVSESELKAWKDRRYLDRILELDIDEERLYGNLAQNCIDQQSYTQVQSLGFIRELSMIRDLIPRGGPIRKLKTYADLFLSYKYGITLTVKDTRALYTDINNAIQTAKSIQVHPRYSSKVVVGKVGDTTITQTYHYKVVSEPYPSEVMDIVRKLWAWKLYPNLETGWEMVPFSFVADWIVDISSMLHRLDQELITQYYKILGVTWSRKVVYSLPADRIVTGSPLVGDVKITNYTREISTKLHYIPFPDFQIQEFHNTMELAALVVQRRR